MTHWFTKLESDCIVALVCHWFSLWDEWFLFFSRKDVTQQEVIKVGLYGAISVLNKKRKEDQSDICLPSLGHKRTQHEYGHL